MGRRIALLTAAIVIAAIGTTLVYLYAKQANDRAIAGAEPQDVLVATALIPAGQSAQKALADGSLKPMSIPAVAVADGAVGNAEVLLGQSALSPIYPGQQILSQLFGEAGAEATGLAIPDGFLAASFAFEDPARVAGFVNANSEVAVFLTAPTAGTDGQPATRLLLPRVTVLAVGAQTASPATDPSLANQEDTPRTTLTLAVTQKQLETLVFAESQGILYLGLRDDDSTVQPGPGTNAGNLFE